MYNWGNVCDVDACPDEWSAKRSKPTIIKTDLKTYLNDLKNILNTFQIVILSKSSYKSTYCNSFNPS